MVQQAGLVDRRAVRQVAAVVQAHAEHGVARLAQRLINRHVCLRARVGLHVGVLGAKNFTHTFDGQILDLIDTFAAAVIALARIALCILIGEHRTHRRHNSFADDVLRCDQLNVARLTVVLRLNQTAEFGVIRLYKFHCLAYHISTSITT